MHPPAPSPEPLRRAPRWARPLLVVLAALFLLEAWLWRRLGPLVDWCAALIPFARLKAAIACWARRLPPYGALLLFLVPILLVEPLNLVALWGFSHHHWTLGAASLLFEKLVGVGLMAFVYGACEPQLRAINWFAWLVDVCLKAKAWADREVAPLKAYIAGVRARMANGAGFLARVAALRRRIFSRG
ncbi:hypothetical protein [Aquabacter cavernae]|uniref:hypothetical protein n=1 Tax=Aquabacter cavernae TaxID=2496029 RepID=UPI000F8C6515|nr:hypothetical protein [Aquabacter cavernae]